MNNNEHTCQVMHYDLFGRREEKYAFLEANSLDSVPWTELKPEDPYRFFVPKDFSLQEEYERGFKIDELFVVQSTGVTTCKDAVNYWDTPDKVQRMVDDIMALTEEQFRERYGVGADSRDWSVARAKQDVASALKDGAYSIEKIEYRQFDHKYVFFSGRTNGIVAWPRYRSLRHMLGGKNIALIVPRQTSQDWRHVYVTTHITDMNILASAKMLGAGVQFPLYTLNPADGGSIFGENGVEMLPNLDAAIVRRIEDAVGEAVEPITLFDYIYAVLHSPTYRTRYRELLKIDFPRIPYPASAAELRRLADIGARLRGLHLMQGVQAEKGMATFDHEGSNTVDKVEYKGGNVHINSAQCFANVPEVAWTFHIGGYQPAQKWLKDRRGRTLTIDDLMHYRRIIAVLAQTAQIMNTIDIEKQDNNHEQETRQQ